MQDAQAANDVLNNLEKTPEVNRKLEYPPTTGNKAHSVNTSAVKGGRNDSDKEGSFRDYLDVQNGQGGGTQPVQD